jgi:multidrug efflux pump subunit AcrA (membrane-fusion protein)
MNATSTRLPVRLPSGLTRSRVGRVSILNALLATLLVGVAVAAYLTVGQSTTSTAGTTNTAAVDRGVVLSTVSATGTLQAAKQLSVNFTSSGELRSVNVTTGQRVKAGQLLGKIDSTSAHQTLLQAQASLTSAEAQYQQTLTGETAQQRQQDALSVSQARQSVTNAKISLAATKKSIALDKRTSATSLSQALQQLRVDQGQLQVDTAKLKTDSVTVADANAAAAAVAADKAQVTAAQATQQIDQQSQFDAQAQQTKDNQQLTRRASRPHRRATTPRRSRSTPTRSTPTSRP